jgi:hypothetical protein
MTKKPTRRLDFSAALRDILADRSSSTCSRIASS